MPAKQRKICGACGKPFLTARDQKQWCSAKCRDAARPMRRKVCAGCGAEFETRQLRRFCSKGCRKYPSAPAKACAWCGSIFQPNSLSHACCSAKCARKHRERSPDYRRKRAERYTSPEYHAKRNAQSKARYAADPSLRAKEAARKAKYRARKRAEVTADFPREAQCEWCEGAFQKKSGAHRFCSPACGKRQGAPRANERKKQRYQTDSEYRANQLASKAMAEGMRAALGP